MLIESISSVLASNKNILEVGCGNGYNAISISKKLKHKVDGFDFIPDMIESANLNLEQLNKEDKERLSFFVGDVLDINTEKKYDLIYSCRCLINLPNTELQDEAIKEILGMLDVGGYFFMLENFNDNYSSQNNIRDLVGLDKRIPAEFNHFFDSSHVYSLVDSLGATVVDVKNFASLHDIVQYIVVPMLNDGVVRYDHDVINAVTKLLMSVDTNTGCNFGDYGQNKLVIIKK